MKKIIILSLLIAGYANSSKVSQTLTDDPEVYSHSNSYQAPRGVREWSLRWRADTFKTGTK